MDRASQEAAPNRRFVNLTSDYFSARFPLFSAFQVEPMVNAHNTSTIADLLSDSKTSLNPTGLTDYASTISTFYSQQNWLYGGHFFNANPRCMKYIDVESFGLVYLFLPYANGSRWQSPENMKTEDQLQTLKSASITETTDYLTNQCQTLCSPDFLTNSPMNQHRGDLSRKIIDKDDRQENCRNDEGFGNVVWELNRRRPSVIRRSISSDGSCSPREAVLTPSVSPQPFNEKEKEPKLHESRPSSPIGGEPHKFLSCLRSKLHPSKASDPDVRTKRSHSSAFNETTTKPSITPKKRSAETINPSSKKKKKCKFLCFFCKKRFQWFSHWQAHERVHTGEKPFRCKQCGRGFTRADGLQCHVSTHLKDERYTCPVCSKTFVKKSSLERHVFDHTGIKPFQCEYCSKQFSDTVSMQAHLLIHKGQRRFTCQYCSHSFINAKRLVRHIRGHTGEKPFKCQWCKMAFSKKSALEIHHRVHTGIKPYPCPECGKAFSIAGNLQRHLLIHTGERPYKCSVCQRTFNNRSHLSRHIKSLHTR